MKDVEQYVPVVLFIKLFKAVEQYAVQGDSNLAVNEILLEEQYHLFIASP